jgi:hypothetical protein
MPIESEVDVAANTVQHRCRDRITVEDIMAAFDRITTHPDYHPNMNVLWDMRGTVLQAAPEKLQSLVTHVALERNKHGMTYKLAIVANESALLMLADIFKALATPLTLQIQVFRSPGKARQWLAETVAGSA